MNLFDTDSDAHDCLEDSSLWPCEHFDLEDCTASRKNMLNTDSLGADRVHEVIYTRSATRFKKKRKVSQENVDGCIYSGDFQEKALTGFGTILYPMNDRLSMRLFRKGKPIS